MPKSIQQKLTQKPQTNQGSEISPLSPSALTIIADFFKVLSEVSRLQIVCALKTGPKNVSQIIEITGLGQANVSKHLKLLTDARILSRTQQGVNVVYEITNPVIFPLCDLVCNSLTVQLQQQHQDLEHLKAFTPSKLA
ncbi:transcriptional regulator, ArsR family [Gloeothece citriformis PCC 7424]|uniref:Transcriptional regulator, ArsR family n=1 Tax=Gloeothece citriformis (strain PCC 7424) TaxID=65393 RepID=B7KB27_GLOC7|nr:metalloregulator ArsR/SmtB family transcription factor [Gloeothece citriformis]ACK70137.1 transcriptional regulator, ArsR family [Gloeothece citriformis PCC 7424]